MFRRLAACLLLFATAAFGHQGVVNPTVMARMSGMTDIESAMKILVAMVKGDVAYDQETAIRARADLIDALADIPVLFAMPDDDPFSEARPEIWTRPPGFSVIAAQSLLAADALDPTSLETLRTGITDIGLTCKSCHDTYRLRM